MTGTERNGPASPQHFDRLQWIYRRVVCLGARDRRAALDEHCGDDRDLRAQVVNLLAQTEPESDREDPLLQFSARVRQALETLTAPEAREDSRFGSYRIVKEIGAGGMGTVFEAEQDDTRRRVALKVLPAASISRATLRRFEREAELLGRLRHPGIAQIFEAGVHVPQPLDDAAGPAAALAVQPFFAMELVRGVTLHQYARRNLPRKVMHAFIKICEAAHYAHEQGVVHRDLKPANILVDRWHQPRVLDFGVARVTDPELRSTTYETDHGQILGTIHYMSPEQAAGDPSRVDRRSDVYSLGVILFELLSGRLPHDFEGLGLPEMVRVVCEREPLRLGDVDISLRGGVLEVIVAKALEKDPNRRYESAQGLANDLLCYLQDRPIAARAPGSFDQLRRLARRNKLLVVAVSMMGIGVAIGLAGLAFAVVAARHATLGLGAGGAIAAIGLILAAANARRALGDLSRQRTLAAQARERAQIEADKAASMQEFLTSMFASALPDKARGRTVTLKEALTEASGALQAQVHEHPEVLAWANDTLGVSFFALGDPRKAEFHLRTALRLRNRHLGEDHPDSLDTVHHLTEVLDALGNPLEAARLADGLVKLRTQVLGELHSDTLAALNLHARALRNRGRYEEAEDLLRRSLWRHRQSLGDEHLQTLATVDLLGTVLQELGSMEEAEELLRAALGGRRNQRGPSHTETLESMNHLAEVLQRRGMVPEAGQLLKEALKLQEKICGAEHPDTLGTLLNLATLYRRSSRTDLAILLGRKVMSAAARTLGDDHPLTLMAMSHLAAALLEQGEQERALSLYQRALRIARQLAPEGSPDIIAIHSNLGQVSHQRGDARTAEKHFAHALEVAEKVLSNEDPRLLVIRANHAVSLIGVKRHREAERILASCYASLDRKQDASRKIPRLYREAIGDLADLYSAWGAQKTVDPFQMPVTTASPRGPR
ncbi:MAG: tetratricopeptide repeat protein [Planctomycetota bacterium]